MTRVLLGVAGALVMLLVLTALRLNAVGADLAQMTDKAQQAAAAIIDASRNQGKAFTAKAGGPSTL